LIEGLKVKEARRSGRKQCVEKKAKWIKGIIWINCEVCGWEISYEDDDNPMKRKKENKKRVGSNKEKKFPG
jgi:hypothetical protein